MNKLPVLDERQYIKTRRQIHSIAKLIGRFRETLVKPIAKNDNLWLSVVSKGFCTPPMDNLNELEIGFNAEILAVEIADNNNRYCSITTNGKTPKEICTEMLNVLNGEFSINPSLSADEFDNIRKIEIDLKLAQDFLLQFTGLSGIHAEFHKNIALNDGVKTQICLWPHHFDNAFKWFSGRKIDDGDEQIGIGVSNGDGMYELPYIYLTIWPALRKTNTLELPEGANLHDTEWQGLILTFEAITDMETAEEQTGLVKDFLEKGFAGIKRGFSKR